MNIIIAGDGEVGFNLAEALVNSNHNITVIDPHEELLKRIESHAGLVILASNMKSNIDTSFTRRFNTIIEFENPGIEERERLWNNYIPENIKVDRTVSIKDISKKYELTGANIVNVIHYVGLQTLKKRLRSISYKDLIKGIQNEYFKEGKMIRKE